mmetsp:Transcript_5464/g.8005  ORF Transcript_5464/g.8005 Transcript_5464/m.8005 type:complete len:163 (+) Transcript_5464:2359-2847(+)
MVVISVKNADGDGFLFETTTDTKNEELIRSLVNIQNDRLRSRLIIDAVRGLAAHGPMKKPQEAGLDEVKETIGGETVEKGPNYAADPTGARTGNAPDAKLAETLERVARDLDEYIDKVIHSTTGVIFADISDVFWFLCAKYLLILFLSCSTEFRRRCKSGSL